MEEIKRILRHFGPVLVVYAVAKGWLPAVVQGPLTDAIIAIMAGSVGFGASKARERTRKKV
jgi:NCAIR mutase (PurE)-related protein